MEHYQYCNFVGAWGKIYTLADDNGNVFYVGVTTRSMKSRLANHLSESRFENNNTTKSSNKRKIAIIQALDFKITATIVHVFWVTADCEKDLLNNKTREVEKQWIQKYLDLGYPLVNGRKEVLKVKSEDFVGKVFKSNGSKISETPSTSVTTTIEA